MGIWMKPDWGFAETASLGVSAHDGGLMAGTQVATAMGWRPVEALAPGDLVLTFDGGMQPLAAVERDILRGADCAMADWPVQVPADALGNRLPLQVMPGTPVMVESDAAEDLYGDPFVMVPALALDGVNGITRVAPPARIETVCLRFAREAAVFSRAGVLVSCPGAADLYASATAPDHTALSLGQAAGLVALMAAQLPSGSHAAA